MSETIVDLNFLEAGVQCFPMYHYEERKIESKTLFDDAEDTIQNNYIRRDAISDFISERCRKAYGPHVSKEDIFYYVYGILHSTEYRTAFAADLKKMLPRIPLVDEALDFWSFSKAGRNLAELHLNYENRPSATGVIVTYNTIPQSEIEKVMQSGEMETINYQVEKMRFPSKTDKSKIIYNSQITIENIPATAYEYIVNGKSAIEWIMERYAVITHKDSGITNNPNDWATEHDNPRYILDLLLSVILQLLKCNNETDSICIEGIEDVDLKTVDESTAIQCKYYAGTEYNHSVIAQPLRYMLDHYLSKANNGIKYKIYGYYKSGQDKLILPINIEFFKSNFISLKAFKGLSIEDKQIISFLSNLEIDIAAREFEQQETDIFNELKRLFSCNDFEAEYFYYNNSLRIVKELSINPDISQRRITKREFIDKINSKDIFFNQWFLIKKSIKEYCLMIKREYFSPLNLSPFERFFVIECDSIISDTEIKSLLIQIGNKYSKIEAKNPSPFCPYVYLYGLPENRLKNILKSLHDDNFIFIDGYDYKDAEFSVNSIVKKATCYNGLKLKILYNKEDLDSVIDSIQKTRKIYQFYTRIPFYENTNHEHIKILVEQTIHINKII